MRRVVVAADTAATMALLSDLRGAVRVRASDGDRRGGMRLEQDLIGPVTLDRMTFGAALDFDAGSAEVLVFGHVSGGSAGFAPERPSTGTVTAAPTWPASRDTRAPR